MANNLDFHKEHKEVSPYDCAMLQIAFISCQGKREDDMYKLYNHFRECRYYCQKHVADQMSSDRGCAGVSLNNMMEKWDRKLLKEQENLQRAQEEAHLYLSGAYGI